jgi:hypothetical protein
MQRETKKVATPSGAEVELVSYITSRERNQLRDIYLAHMRVNTDSGTPNNNEISGIVVAEVEKKLIEITVISYAGSKEKILDRLLDSRPEEYDFVLAEANKVNGGNLASAK